MWYREYKICLHDNQYFNYPNTMQVLVFLRQLEYAFLGAPVLGGFELEERAFGVAGVESYGLPLLYVEAGHPHVVVHGGRVHWGEILHDLQRDEPGVHQEGSRFIDPKMEIIRKPKFTSRFWMFCLY